MLKTLCHRFWRERRAATVMVLAVMIVPMIIAAGAAYDFARLAAARAQLQAAVDGAALAGVGAYANDISTTNYTTSAAAANAGTVANAAFTNSIGGNGVLSLDETQGPSVTIGCTGGTSAVCGGGGYTPSCSVATATYCVTANASATQKNGLFYGLLGETISVGSTAVISSGGTGQTANYNNLAQSWYSANGGGSGGGGGINIGHGSGIGAGTPNTINNATGYDPVAYFIDGNNAALPSAEGITYANEAPTGSPAYCSGAGQTISSGTPGPVSVPAQIYCGGLTLGSPPIENWDLLPGSPTTPGSTVNALRIINGALTVAPETIACPEELPAGVTYSGPNVSIAQYCNGNGYAYTPIYFGQNTSANSGSLVMNYNIDITPTTQNNGLLTFVSNEAAILHVNNSNFTETLGASVCPGGVTSCSSGAVSAANVVYKTSSRYPEATVKFQSTYISTETIQNGDPVAWTEQKVMASTFTTAAGTQTNTQTAQSGGTYSVSGNTYTPVTARGAPYTNVATTYTPSTLAVGDGAGNDAYTQLNTGSISKSGTLAQAGCLTTAGKTNPSSTLGGTAPIDNTAVPGISVSSPGEIFALATATPPSATPDQAYNFTDPNYGYSFVAADEEGAVQLDETAYFCGNGPPLSVKGGDASGVTVSSSGGGASLVN